MMSRANCGGGGGGLGTRCGESCSLVMCKISHTSLGRSVDGGLKCLHLDILGFEILNGERCGADLLLASGVSLR